MTATSHNVAAVVRSHHFAASQDRPGTDEANPRQGAKRQAHHVGSHDRYVRIGSVDHQPVGLDHCRRGCDRHQNCGPLASRMGGLAAIRTDQETC
jgi:hypothetical protein